MSVINTLSLSSFKKLNKNLDAFLDNNIHRLYKKSIKQLFNNNILSMRINNITDDTTSIKIVKNNDISVHLLKNGSLYVSGKVKVKNTIMTTPPGLTEGFIYGISDKHELYIWNYNNNIYYKKLIQIHDNNSTISTKAILTCDNKKVEFSRIFTGSSHGFLVDTKKRTWGFGDNTLTQLGTEKDIFITVPTLIEPLSKIPIVEIVCGCFRSLFLSENGNVYLCGGTRCYHCNLIMCL
ncbi:hypothetical protein PIROE2DRAFT_60075 [Piromyces sp. E2]|nr:hypothetical protein PIROE2DRAFT_60075 [Piromyces sp. E2]|eukprot:OUM65343.1 hypothetical protein PIROE2DRAFT_60075 [Piromyces sp. E2]